jgi:hypothetical protein
VPKGERGDGATGKDQGKAHTLFHQSITAGTSERRDETAAAREQRKESTARRQEGWSKEGIKGFKGGGETFQANSNGDEHEHEHEPRA